MRQLSILGIGWPPPKNWPRLISGLVITDAQAEEFEQAKNIKVKRNKGRYLK